MRERERETRGVGETKSKNGLALEECIEPYSPTSREPWDVIFMFFLLGCTWGGPWLSSADNKG